MGPTNSIITPVLEISRRDLIRFENLQPLTRCCAFPWLGISWGNNYPTVSMRGLCRI